VVIRNRKRQNKLATFIRVVLKIHNYGSPKSNNQFWYITMVLKILEELNNLPQNFDFFYWIFLQFFLGLLRVFEITEIDVFMLLIFFLPKTITSSSVIMKY
jgi:hypothetical protein